MPLKSIGDKVNWQEHLASIVRLDKTRSHPQLHEKYKTRFIHIEEGNIVTMQQLMETICALQETVATTKTDQDRIMVEVRAEQAASQDQFQVNLDASRTDNEDLRKANEELRRDLQRMRERATRERTPPIPVRTRPMPFSQAIISTVIPTNFMTPKITFTSTEDSEAHITTFHTQMMISGGTDAMHCKFFMGTFSGTTLDWLISLLDGHITLFDQFSTLFRKQFIVNRAPPLNSFDLFDMKQYQGEPLKDFLNQFGALVVKVHTKDEAMMVHAFRRRTL